MSSLIQLISNFVTKSVENVSAKNYSLLSQTSSVPSVPLARDENWLRGPDVVNRSETALIECEAGASTGIDIEQRLFERDIAESFDEWHFKFPPSDRDLQHVAALVTKLEEIFRTDVRD